ncbi:MAG: carbohydrate kinase [Saprospiraceae bacterium]|nr:carbohydrate kinase [Saprospiraceae bacterium]
MLETISLFDKLAQAQVLIVGDVMIDRYWHGKVNRISPEAPVPVVELQRTEDRLGGAANVALNIKAMGATPYLFSVIGSDTEGGDFLNLMQQNGLPTVGIVTSDERITTVKTRIMAGTQQMLRIDNEIVSELSAQLERDFLMKFKDFIKKQNIDVIILQDYNKGVLSAQTIETVLSEATQNGIPTAVDPKKQHFLSYKNATLFKPNLKEIRDAVPFSVQPEWASLQNASAFLNEKLHNRFTMITLSDKGLYLNDSFTEGGAIYPTQPRNIADVSGAGDTVISVAALCLAVGTDSRLMAQLSNLAGSQVCEVAGVVPVNREQLKKEFMNLV